MTNKTMLERELLCRKNEQLDFLNKILTKASKSLNPGTIINQAGKDLKILLEVESRRTHPKKNRFALLSFSESIVPNHRKYRHILNATSDTQAGGISDANGRPDPVPSQDRRRKHGLSPGSPNEQ
ncbi:MAG: hypothetical protein WC124_10580 [Desulfoplanes sp.]